MSTIEKDIQQNANSDQSSIKSASNTSDFESENEIFKQLRAEPADEKNDLKMQDESYDQLRAESASNKNDFESENDNSSEKRDIADKIIDSANQYFLLKILSPEITKNEDKKRTHKDKLINIVQLFLIFQFIILLVLVFGTITMIFVFHWKENDLELSYVNAIIKFISVYITSVVVELIAMLNYIVSKVFDTSITGLVELYKDKSKDN